MRVVTAVGNRPQFVKAAPLSLALRSTGIDEIAVHTGQHWDPEMSAIFYEELGLAPPAFALDLRTPRIAAIEEAVSVVLEKTQPRWVLVLGDTNTTAGATRAARRHEIPVAHLEAGLRSGDLSMPEEQNRLEVDSAAQLLFPPDERSADTLRTEGVTGEIVVTGDVMADASRLFAPLARRRYTPPFAPHSYVVATIHREANVQPKRLRRIIEGLGRVGYPVLLPAHPRTREAITEHRIRLADTVTLLAPMGYLELCANASQARAIVTDSGGLQKEAYWYGVPCVTTRPSTEWKDTVELGANVLVDDDPDALVAAVRDARFPAEAPPLYGDGYASSRVAAALADRIRGR